MTLDQLAALNRAVDAMRRYERVNIGGNREAGRASYRAACAAIDEAERAGIGSEIPCEIEVMHSVHESMLRYGSAADRAATERRAAAVASC